MKGMINLKVGHHDNAEARIFLNNVAVKYIVQELIDGEYLQGNGYYTSIESILNRSLSMYTHFCEEVNKLGKVDSVKLAEFKIHLKMAIKEPDMYFIGNWAECFDSQHFLHDLQWAKEILDNEDEEEKEEDAHYNRILKDMGFRDL